MEKRLSCNKVSKELGEIIVFSDGCILSSMNVVVN